MIFAVSSAQFYFCNKFCSDFCCKYLCIFSVSIYACCVREYFGANVLKSRFKIDVVTVDAESIDR